MLAASWSELGRVNIWDLSEQLQIVDSDILLSKYNKEKRSGDIKPLFSFHGHQYEGFAIDWSPTVVGVRIGQTRNHSLFIKSLKCLKMRSDKTCIIFFSRRIYVKIFCKI